MGNGEQPDWTNKKGWERGDDAEKEVARLQRIEEERRVADMFVAQAPRDSNKSASTGERLAARKEWTGLNEKLYEHFYDSVKSRGGVYKESFEIKEDGTGTIVERFDDHAGTGLLDCVDTLAVTKDTGITPDDLRATARQIEAKYPEITFSFGDGLKKFSYTATLKQLEK